ncbi:MAG: PsiF family protein, partial [Bryobacteraceae bacterium]
TNASAQIKTPTPQQQKFAECAHQSKGMKGEAHKKFMSECLKGSGAAASMKSEASKAKTEAGKAEEKTKSVTSEQREKMKNCNAQAKEKNLKGKDRRSFMSECLKD